MKTYSVCILKEMNEAYYILYSFVYMPILFNANNRLVSFVIIIVFYPYMISLVPLLSNKLKKNEKKCKKEI